METIERPRNLYIKPTVMENRSRPRKRLPVLFVVALIASIALILKYHASGIILAAGLLGVASSLELFSKVLRGSPLRRPVLRLGLSVVWLAAMLALSASFISSGLSHLNGGPILKGLAAVEARRTIEAAGLFLVWLIGIILVRRVRVPFTLFWSVATFEATRLLALGLRPNFLSYGIWAGTVVIGGMAVRASKG